MLLEMPHAVHHFLKMVELKLWDGMAMTHGTGADVIKATPTTMDGSHHQWAGQRFVAANLTHMAFTEFSSTYPQPHHHKYSVAFSGRPGGPDFYISLEDELEFHELESTFGRVIDGHDVLDRFFFERDYPEQEHRKRVNMMRIQSMEMIE
jgi:cyclophilin family peptidyl-prolyl cis-trans isomerase